MGRRSNGEGYFQKLKSGSWLGQVMVGYTTEGKRNIKSFTAPTKAEVQIKIRKYLTARESQPEEIAKDISFSNWAKSWYKSYQGQVQASTFSGYRYTLKTLIEYFGDSPLSSIKQMRINLFLNYLAEEGYSQSKISKCKAMLVQIFDAAEENELVARNPALRAKGRKMGDTIKNTKDAFTEEEEQLLLKFLPDNLMGNSIRTLLGSGLRVQELLALTPKDIEPDGSIIQISKAVKMVDGKPVLGSPKSRRSNRIVPIPLDYRPYVCRMLEQGARAFIWTSTRENLLYSVGTFRKKYYEVLKTVPGVRLLSPHCCRHTYITRLQAKGISLELIARLVGHSNVATTDDYAHTSVQTLAGVVSVLNQTTDKEVISYRKSA